ncbi:phenylalanyl-tRNA synthetase beta subunit [bacterium A37T11]|nr:phenylalanyl-tRNA synthetase beta subunit [bacterium A37T11]
MNISYNWLKQFISFKESPQELSFILTDIGLEVEALHIKQAIPGGLEGLLIAEVKTCIPHPNADRLRITTIDAGGDELLQVVCGAPNVAAGQKVVLAPVGATVYPLQGEPFKINKSKIRGEVSEGMICAEDEIGLGHSHEGILVLQADAAVGSLAKDFFKIEDDYLFEIGLTPNRADAASHLGVARDLAAFLRKRYNLPDVLGFYAPISAASIPVKVENAKACPRYSSLSISGVTIAESPDWLKNKLNTIGVRPINNVVDVTNYVLHGLGQPMHAFDADKIEGAAVRVRNATEGEIFTTLDGVERKLSSEDLVIADAVKPLCIAGVFGGSHSGITLETTNIFLESAYFHPVSVRKTSKRHGLKTDASFRFERGTDPNMTVLAIKYAALAIMELAGGTISSGLSDFYPEPIQPFKVLIDYKNIQRLIGEPIPENEIKSIITSLGIAVKEETETGLNLEVPPYKVDVTREVDIIEEVLRIYGYNRIGIGNQIKASLNTSPKPDKELIQNQLSDLLIGNGFHEILSNSLTKAAYADDLESLVKIVNPLSTDLDSMRQTLLFSALEAVAYNQKRRNADLKLFEFGKSYHLLEEGYKERQHLSLLITGLQHAVQWNQSSKPTTFFLLKGIVDGILKRLNIRGLEVDDNPGSHFSYGLRYLRGPNVLLSFGAVNDAAKKLADVEGEVFYADLDFDLLLKTIRKNKIKYQEVTKFPAVRRDLSLLIDQNVSFGLLKAIAEKTERKLLKSVQVFDVYQGDSLPKGKKSYAMSFILQDEEKTLNDKQIDTIVQKLILNFEKEAGATIRG